MILIPLGVTFVGYCLVWFGATELRGGGIGMLDLLKPSAIATVDGVLSTTKTGSSPATTTPGDVAQSAVAGAAAGAAITPPAPSAGSINRFGPQ